MTIPETCPQCGHTPVTELVYGLMRGISKELAADIEAGKMAQAGCMMTAESPAYICRACGYKVSVEEAQHPLFMLATKALAEDDS